MSLPSRLPLVLACLAVSLSSAAMTKPPAPSTRTYSNVLTPIKNPRPILADHPEFFAPIIEQAHFEAACCCDPGHKDARWHLQLAELQAEQTGPEQQAQRSFWERMLGSDS